MLIQSGRVLSLYHALFDWQPPLSLWETSETLKGILGDELLTSRDVGAMEIKKILEGWVIGKSLSMAYHGTPCMVRVARTPAMDGQIYQARSVGCVEVTQALFPGRRRNVFGKPYDGILSHPPLSASEREAYEVYRDAFIRQAFLQVEARIDHKFQLYKTLDYLLVYVDLFDTRNPRFCAFALEEFYDEYEEDLEVRLQQMFRTRWSDKIGHLFLLDDRPSGFVTRFGQNAHTPLHEMHEQISLA